MATNIPRRDPIVALAARQQGNVTRAQLLALGLGPAGIACRVRTGRLHREHRGVYSVGRPARTALERASAAVLACGPEALLSHAWALALWALRRGGWPAGVPEVTVPGDRRPKGIRVHRSTSLSRRDARHHHGIRVTSPARTLLDNAERLSERALARAVNDAMRAPHCNENQLAELLTRCPNHRSAHLLTPFVELRGAPTRSELEDAFLAFCERFELPGPLTNTRVGGYEVDAYFPAQRLIIELDGWDFHNDRLTFETDRRRDADALLAGIATVRVTHERMHGQPEREAELLRGILAGRAPGGAGA